MLVQTLPKNRWRRDPGVADLIEHLDRPEKINKPENLTPAEMKAILREVEKCRADFSYAARNYFWIEDKHTRQDILFRLWESQELVLEIIMNLKAKGLSQRLMVIKARQLGMSTIVEGLIAWRTMFFINVNSLIVSYEEGHSAYLFGIALKFYDKLPWWLKPMCASREFKKGLILDNPDPEQRLKVPGLNSKIDVKYATAITGVGQGFRLSAVHLSEYADYEDKKARNIIEEDVINALADTPETFGVLESTPKGAGRYAHKLWITCEKMAERAAWLPVFLPWFFDKSHRVTVDLGWKPRKEEVETREKISRDWVRCDNPQCRQFHRRSVYGRNYLDVPCPTCEGQGTLKVFLISNEQLAWMQQRREQAATDEESQKKLSQEQATTAEEAFVVSGVKLFSDQGLRFAALTCGEPIAQGFIAKDLKFHGHNHDTGRCWLQGCEIDHRYELDSALSVYEWPEPETEYVIGADVSEGIGQDYSCASVIKKNPWGGADEQVAIWARNDVDAVTYAEFLNKLGRFYNDALIAVEINKFDTAETTLRLNLQYPNCYVSKAMSSENIITKRFGWSTTLLTKPRLWQSLRKKLDLRLILLRDKFTVEEMKNFRKEDDSNSTGAAEGFHDDRIMATMIAHYVAHELDWDENNGIIKVRTPVTMDTAPIIFHCKGCNIEWPANSTSEYRRCPDCRSMVIEAKDRINPSLLVGLDLDDDSLDDEPMGPDDLPDYDEL